MNIMKQGKRFIMLACLVWVIQASAGKTTFKDRTENWLQRTETNGSGRPGIDEDTPKPDVPGAPGPIGDAIVWLFASSLVYGVYLYRKKKKIIA
jgi:hypothetical protein